VLAAAVYLVTYTLLVLRRCRWGTQDEIVGLGVVTVFLSATLTAASMTTDPALLPASVAIAGPPCASTLWLALRYLARQFHRARRRRGRETARRTVVVGAGWGARRAVDLMLDDANSNLAPVALVDDDPRKRSLSVSGVRVRGRVDDLPAVCRRENAEVVLLAVPSAGPELVERVMALAGPCDVDVLVMPSFDEMVSVPRREDPAGDGLPVGLSVEVPRQTFRSVRLEDLLGRGAIEIDEQGIGRYLQGRVVLVTGAGGSIGSQLCREIANFGPARLVMTDRDDSLLHGVQLSVDGRGMLDSEDLVLGDLRDRGFVQRLVRSVRPDVVFHAAAVKHLTLAERFPAEAFSVNVGGTLELLTACVDCGVDRFVNISTDKAADPSSVLGFTKRLTERLTATFGWGAPEQSRYISVRFGNVLGSRGSALPTFAAQLVAGRPLTITSPDMSRFFMTVHEATQLVLQAAVHGRTGEGLVLDMGEPHNIEDLARRFAALNGYPDPHIQYTGVRPGEKLTERTLATDEPDERPHHPLVSHVPMPRLDLRVLDAIESLRDDLVSGVDVPDVTDLLAALALSRAPVHGLVAPAGPDRPAACAAHRDGESAEERTLSCPVTLTHDALTGRSP
jgi:FlaA1/EpsC-like NDP-sugar epimerase